ncbi:MAG: hypothetical protein KDD94_00060 [Calditrichaeota bacterium]|nr:hypothetical protein [Calditrichota bacterium]
MSSISNLLTRCRTAINNALNDAGLAAKLAAYGYDTTEINAGKALYEAALSLDDLQNHNHASEKQVYTDYKKRRNQLRLTYMKHLKVARIAFRDNQQAFSELLLAGKRDPKFDIFEKQYHSFYSGLTTNADYQTSFNRYIPQADVTAAAAEFNAVLTLHENYLIAIAETQNATEERNQAIDRLEKWYADFTIIAKVAFSDSPQQLEKLGIKA